MRPLPALAILLLAGCSLLQYHPGASFAATEQFAIAAVPAAELDLARMLADPDAYPASRGRAADPMQAAKWCFILNNGPPAPPPPATNQGPSCSEILDRTPPDLRSEASNLAYEWLLGPLGYIER